MSDSSEAVRRLEAIPDGSLVPIEFAREIIRELLSANYAAPNEQPSPEIDACGKRIWTIPAETRLGVKELSEATGKPASWIYRHTSRKSGAALELDLLPHRKLDGGLVFIAGEIRAWLQAHERTIVKPSPDVVPIGRRAVRKSG